MNKGNYKYYADYNYFEKIDSEDKAYFLGFIFADGCVFRGKKGDAFLRINIHIKDIEILENFKIVLNTNIPLKYTLTRPNSVTFTIHGQKIVEDLEKLGCGVRKSLTLEFPQIPDNLLHHFMRGYFDGDGCIKKSLRNNSLSGTFELTSSVMFSTKYAEKLSSNINVTMPKVRLTNKANGVIAWTGRGNITKIYNYLYKDSTIYLKRKKERFDELVYSNEEINKKEKTFFRFGYSKENL